jgi:hypothetical protein
MLTTSVPGTENGHFGHLAGLIGRRDLVNHAVPRPLSPLQANGGDDTATAR